MTDISTIENSTQNGHKSISAPPRDEVERAQKIINQARAAQRASAKPKAPRTFQSIGSTAEVKGTWRVSEKTVEFDQLKPNEVFSLTRDGLTICIKASSRKFIDLRRGRSETAIPTELYRVFF